MAAKATGTVWVVHCIDTEGPLEETLDATFERINARFGTALEPSRETLQGLQRAVIPVGGLEAAIAKFIAPHRLAYLSSWEQVEAMVSQVSAPGFRQEHHDSAGAPYVFSWFVIDVVGYTDNPRRKAVGYHAVWDHYQRMLKGRAKRDSFGWHFHTVPVGGHALEYNTCWTNNDHHEQAIARRLIERRFFPSTFRAGGIIERNDLSHWLEMYVPFDYSSAASTRGPGVPGNIWDWRHAPASWEPYSPDWYDYRRPGSMRRSIFRCLEIAGYEYVLKDSDVREAFDAALSGRDVLLSYTSHDRRDLTPDVEAAVSLLRRVAAAYPDVTWRFTNALDAAQRMLGRTARGPVDFTTRWEGNLLWINSSQELFGPAPFIAVEEEGGIFFRDNPTQEGPRTWAYAPHRLARTRRIGIGGATSAGDTGVAVIDLGTGP